MMRASQDTLVRADMRADTDRTRIITMEITMWLHCCCFLRILLPWLLHVGANGQPLALTASTPFRMILSPTSLELKSAALELIKEAATEHVLEFSSSASLPVGQNYEIETTTAPTLASIEIVFQSEEFLSAMLATRISFFALATYRAAEPEEVSTRAERQSNLNTILMQAFSTTDRRAMFLERIRRHISDSKNETANQATITEQLQILESLVVASVLPFTEAESASIAGDDRAKLPSKVDIILMAISGTILVGMLWMLWELYKDHAFTVTQSRRVWNARGPSRFAIPRAYFEEGFHVDDDESGLKSESLSASLDKSRISAYDCSPILELQNISMESSPSTPSTIASSMIVYSEEDEAPNFSMTVSDATAAVFASGMRPQHSPTEPRNLLPPYQSDDEEELVSDFGDNWFRKRAFFLPHRKTRDNVAQDCKNGESTGGDDNSSDDDVFFVARESSNHSPSHGSLEYSVSEWMSTIQVAAPENSTADSVLSAGSRNLPQEDGRADVGYARSYAVASLLERSWLERKSSSHSAASSPSDSDSSVSTVYDEDDEKKTAR